MRDGAPLRVLLVDDHPVVLAGLTALVEAAAGLQVSGAVTGVTAALELPHDPAPHVCVIDLRLPDGDGVALGAALKQRWPRTRVLVLTMTADPSAVVRSLGAGLDGYLLKDCDPDELVAAVRMVAGGSVVLGPGASGPVLAAAATLPDGDPLAALDARDREILGLLAQGCTVGQTAQRLFLAPKTIRNRTSEIVAKLGVATREEAISLARSSPR